MLLFYSIGIFSAKAVLDLPLSDVCAQPFVLCMGLAAAGLLLCVACLRKHGGIVALCLCVALAGFAASARAFLRVRLPNESFGGAVDIEATVENANPSGKQTVIRVLSDAYESESPLVGRRLLLGNARNGSHAPLVGDHIRVRGFLSTTFALNPGEFDYELFYASRNISGRLDPDSSGPVLQSPQNSSLARSVSKARFELALIIKRSLPAKQASFINGILIGDTGDLDSDTMADFKNTGVYHVLSVSGLHVGFVMLPLLWCLDRIPNLWLKLCTQVCVLSFYCLLAGGQLAVIRSSIMALSPHLARLLGRRVGPLDNLFFACLGILLFRPLAAFDPGFRLSVGATAGLVLLQKPLSTLLARFPKRLRDALVPTIAAQLMTLPLLAGRSGISVLSLVANPIIVPVCGAALSLAMGGAMAAMLLPSALTRLALFPAGFFAQVSMGLARAIASVPVGALPLSPMNAVSGAVYLTVLLLAMRVWKPRFFASLRARPAANAVMVLLACLAVRVIAPRAIPGALTLSFVAVGQGDAILIQALGGTILVDCGPQSDVGSRLVPFLYHRGVRTIDYVILTHRHEDHCGGLDTIRENFRVKTVLSYAGAEVASEAEDVLVLNSDVQCTIREGWGLCFSHRSGRGPTLSVNALWPGYEAQNNSENERSVVLSVRYGRFHALLTADAGILVEEELIRTYTRSELKAQVLKVGHHGSKHSSGERFVGLVSPDLSVIQVGRNSFGHPSAEVVERLAASGSMVFRTDLHGVVSVITDGKRMGFWWHRKVVKPIT